MCPVLPHDFDGDVALCVTQVPGGAAAFGSRQVQYVWDVVIGHRRNIPAPVLLISNALEQKQERSTQIVRKILTFFKLKDPGEILHTLELIFSSDVLISLYSLLAWK